MFRFLPHDMKAFLKNTQNKADLANFLSCELTKVQVQPGQELVVAGGFSERERVFSTSRNNIPILCVNHEEADTRLILHAQDACLEGFTRTTVICRDTDVLVLLLNFRGELSEEIVMQTGTYSEPKYVAVHELDVAEELINGILGFHAISGCDTRIW